MSLFTRRDTDPPPGAPVGELTISPREFARWKALIHEKSGINLGPEKLDLVRARLGKRLRKLGLTSFQDYFDMVTERDRTGQELVTAIDLITTNKTEFFRERNHFDMIAREIVPRWMEERRGVPGRKLRCWCAACSTGEEPYSLAVTFLEIPGFSVEWNIKILASDLSTRVLRSATAGIYGADRLGNLRREQIARHFQKVDDQRYRIAPAAKRLVAFRHHNLITGAFPFEEKLDIVFCRNVMIYFDEPTKAALVSNLARMLKPDGYLFVGMSESLQRITAGLRYVAPSVYHKEGNVGGAPAEA